VFSTLAGGLLAIRFRRSLTILIAFAAGLLLGAAFLDLLPEALVLNATAQGGPAHVLGIALISFLVFLGIQSALDRLETRWKDPAGPHRGLGRVGGSMLIFHSLRDGMAIGLSYAASHPAGYAVAAGIAAHDIGDGMNTVILTTGGRKPTLSDYLFLAADCLAPLAGGLMTVWWSFSTNSSVILLAVAAGFFLQMATSDFLPGIRTGEGSRSGPLVAVVTGAALIYAANLLVGELH
jgi:zinc transporter ZupT